MVFLKNIFYLFLIVFTCFFMVVFKKIIIKICKIIKNKILDVKFISKNIKNILGFQIDFFLQNIRE